MASAAQVQRQTAGLDEAIGHCYPRLLQVAAHFLQSEPRDCDLEANELVHETYLRLLTRRNLWLDQRHFLNLAAQIMRCILCDVARRRSRVKRGAQYVKVSLDRAVLPCGADQERRLAVKQQLAMLFGSRLRWKMVAELRMAGYQLDEIAELCNVSTKTVQRDWRMAKALVTPSGAGVSLAPGTPSLRHDAVA